MSNEWIDKIITDKQMKEKEAAKRAAQEAEEVKKKHELFQKHLPEFWERFTKKISECVDQYKERSQESNLNCQNVPSYQLAIEKQTFPEGDLGIAVNQKNYTLEWLAKYRESHSHEDVDGPHALPIEIREDGLRIWYDPSRTWGRSEKGEGLLPDDDKVAQIFLAKYFKRI